MFASSATNAETVVPGTNADRLGDAARDLFRMDCDEQAPAQVGDKLQLRSN